MDCSVAVAWTRRYAFVVVGRKCVLAQPLIYLCYKKSILASCAMMPNCSMDRNEVLWRLKRTHSVLMKAINTWVVSKTSLYKHTMHCEGSRQNKKFWRPDQTSANDNEKILVTARMGGKTVTFSRSDWLRCWLLTGWHHRNQHRHHNSIAAWSVQGQSYGWSQQAY